MSSTEPKWNTVFVHGIFSSGAIFKPMAEAFAKNPAIAGCATFDYDYNAKLTENAARLAEELAKIAAPVVLVGHSMGGLIARLAVLGGDVPNVRRVVMLGTPNFGAIRTSTAGLLAQLMLRATGKLAAVFRRPGILELTRVPKIFEQPIRKGEANARQVEYVTIPGTFFNESREVTDIGKWRHSSAVTAFFAFLEIGGDLLNQFPLWKSEIARPHDGIVEERSNALIPWGPGRNSEKSATLLEREIWGSTYAHVWIRQCDELTHVGLHSDPEVIQLVSGLAGSESLSKWFDGLAPAERLRLQLKVEPDLPYPHSPKPPVRRRRASVATATTRL
jgi:pimeloyl-ACP methyl ester carboxylesterase